MSKKNKRRDNGVPEPTPLDDPPTPPNRLLAAPESPTQAPTAVDLTDVERLTMEKLILEGQMLDARRQNTDLRRAALDREASALNEEIAANNEARNSFIVKRGLDITQTVALIGNRLAVVKRA